MAKYALSKDVKEIFIQGVNAEGKVFRPSDWAERLAGVLSSFRPGGAKPGDHISYSPCKVRDRSSRVARCRAHGMGLCHQLCR